jgi:hypothetical protein
MSKLRQSNARRGNQDGNALDITNAGKRHGKTRDALSGGAAAAIWHDLTIQRPPPANLNCPFTVSLKKSSRG